VELMDPIALQGLVQEAARRYPDVDFSLPGIDVISPYLDQTANAVVVEEVRSRGATNFTLGFALGAVATVAAYLITTQVRR